MIVRTLLRTPGAFKIACSYTILNRAKQLQGYQCYHGINLNSKEMVKKGGFGPMDSNRKRKTGTPVWRPISTQSGSDKGNNEIDEAEALVVTPSSTHQIDIQKDSEDVLGDSSMASVGQSSGVVDDAGKVTIVSKAKHAVSVEVGSSVMRFIKGKDGATQKGIEDTGVKIIFPRYNEDSIVIEGDSMDEIATASQKIQSIINEAAKGPGLAYSHFISFPLAIHPELVDKVARFQSIILGRGDPKVVNVNMDECTSTNASRDAGKVDLHRIDRAGAGKLKVEDNTNRVELDIKNIPIVSYAPKTTKSDLRIDESLFLKPQRLHLTILMLKLWKKERIHAAADVLQGIHSKVNEVLDNRPLFVRLKGLDLMRGSKANAQVLYAPIEEIGDGGRLTHACQIIRDAYVNAGLVIEKDALQKLKLHATLMNTTFRRSWSQNRYDSFDARGIFEQFGTEEWGEYQIREAHLSHRSVFDDNGFYHCCGSIPFPEDNQVHDSSTASAQTELEELQIAESA